MIHVNNVMLLNKEMAKKKKSENILIKFRQTLSSGQPRIECWSSQPLSRFELEWKEEKILLKF